LTFDFVIKLPFSYQYTAPQGHEGVTWRSRPIIAWRCCRQTLGCRAC